MDRTPTTIFYSYSHKDESLQEQLETHLSLLCRNGYVKTWHDRCITPGKEWEAIIDHHMDEADVILLLVSPDFIASDYCYGKELGRAMERHERKESLVIPIILRPVDLTEAPFARLQALPRDAKPVTMWSNQDEAWLDVESGIKKAIADIQETKHRSTTTTGLTQVRQVIVEELKRLESIYSEPSQKGTPFTGLPTGIHDLDNMLDGLQSSELVVIAARPSMGKTAFVANLAVKTAIDRNQPVAFFSMQMAAQQVVRRLIATAAEIDSARISRGYLGEKDFPKLVGAVGKLVDAPLFLDESPRLSIREIATRAKSLKIQSKIQLVIIDSLQQVLVSGVNEFNEGAAALKTLARELQVPVVVTSNVVREVEKRGDKRPRVADLGDWESLDHEADVLLFLYRDDVYNFKSIDRGIVEILIAKNRNGPTGIVRALYRPEESMFKDIIDDYELVEEEEK